MYRGSLGCVLAVSTAACNAGTGGSGDGTTSAASSTGEPQPSTSSAGTTTAADTTTSTPASSSSSSSSGAGETHTIIFDVGTMVDVPIDNTTGEPIDWDCDALVQPFVSELELVAPRGYHDVAFDDEGNIIGWDGASLIASTYDDVTSVFLPGVGDVQGMDVLANGDLLWTGSGTVRRVTPDQVQSVVTASVGGYGLTVGPDQLVYVCGDGVWRIDPESGDANLWLDTNFTPRALVFNLDSTGVYISTLGPGTVYFVPVDDELNPSDVPVPYAASVGQGYHDGLGIDACGNLYVPDFNTRGLYRVDTAAVVTTLYTQATSGPSHYGHGLEWGSGIGGWNDHAIYLPQPYDSNTVNEIVLGVPSGSRVRTWNP